MLRRSRPARRASLVSLFRGPKSFIAAKLVMPHFRQRSGDVTSEQPSSVPRGIRGLRSQIAGERPAGSVHGDLGSSNQSLFPQPKSRTVSRLRHEIGEQIGPGAAERLEIRDWRHLCWNPLGTRRPLGTFWSRATILIRLALGWAGVQVSLGGLGVPSPGGMPDATLGLGRPHRLSNRPISQFVLDPTSLGVNSTMTIRVDQSIGRGGVAGVR